MRVAQALMMRPEQVNDESERREERLVDWDGSYWR